VAILLPVILRDATKSASPEYSVDVERCASWKEGVDVMGVRTHFYLEVRSPVAFSFLGFLMGSI
jgi:hypothetical protein